VLVVSVAPPAAGWDTATRALGTALSGCGGAGGAVFDVAVAEDGAVLSARAVYGPAPEQGECASSRVANLRLPLAGMSRVFLRVR